MLWDRMPQVPNYGSQIISCQINVLVTVKISTGHTVKKWREIYFGVMLTTALFIMLSFPACYLENKERKL
jgi:hypothetical protein